MHEIRQQHLPHLLHHVEQGLAWLGLTEDGKNTAAQSYAAFEFRFAIERLVIHYWAMLLGRRPVDSDLKTIESFKAIERAIYDLAGHQAQINGHFAFMRIMLDLVQANVPMHTPNISQLSKYWHACSEMCHIAWVLGSAVSEVRADADRTLAEVSKMLSDHLQTASVWPAITHPPIIALRERLIRGEISEDEIRLTLANDGLWAQIEHNDGQVQFVGKAVPPAPSAEA
jgi:hypothetical protein